MYWSILLRIPFVFSHWTNINVQSFVVWASRLNMSLRNECDTTQRKNVHVQWTHYYFEPKSKDNIIPRRSLGKSVMVFMDRVAYARRKVILLICYSEYGHSRYAPHTLISIRHVHLLLIDICFQLDGHILYIKIVLFYFTFVFYPFKLLFLLQMIPRELLRNTLSTKPELGNKTKYMLVQLYLFIN